MPVKYDPSTLDPQQESDSQMPTVGGDQIGSELAALIRRRPAHGGITSAVVESISPNGVPRIVVAGDTQTCDASSLVQFPSAAAASGALLGRTVLVLLEQHAQPVILGVVAPRLWAADHPAPVEARGNLPDAAVVSVQLDKRCLESRGFRGDPAHVR